MLCGRRGLTSTEKIVALAVNSIQKCSLGSLMFDLNRLNLLPQNPTPT